MDLFRINFSVKGFIFFFFWLYSSKIIHLRISFFGYLELNRARCGIQGLKKIDNPYWTLWKRRHHLRSHSLSQRIKLLSVSKLDYPSSENWPMLCLFQEHPTRGRCSKDYHCKYRVWLITSLIEHEPLASNLMQPKHVTINKIPSLQEADQLHVALNS